MNILDLVIDGKNYKYIDTITIDDISYIVFTDETELYIKKYEIVDKQIKFEDIDDEIYNKVRKMIINE